MAVFVWSFLLQCRVQRLLQCLFPVNCRSDQQCYESNDSHALLNRMGNRPNRHWNHLHLAHKLENYLPNHTCTLISASVFCILQHIRLSKIFSHKTQVQRGKAYCGKDRFCQLEEIQRVHSQVTTRLLIENGKL